MKLIAKALQPIDPAKGFRPMDENIVRWLILVVIPLWIIIIIVTVIASHLIVQYMCIAWIGTGVTWMTSFLSPFVPIFE